MIRKLLLQHLLFALGFLLSATIPFAHGESSTCLTVYKNGGAPAVFQSPKCPRWKLSDYDSPPHTTARCQSAMLQGRRNSQEDRTLCVLDVRIPFPRANGIKEVVVGIVAVFDGHNGAEASEMASKLLVEYFVLHTYFLLDATFSVISKTSTGTVLHKRDRDHVNLLHRWKETLGWQQQELHFERFQNRFSANLDDSFHLEILKEALLRAIHDIDANFSEEASRNNLHSGSTATVVLVADDKILVANIGDSKAFLCSEKFQSPKEAKVNDITSDLMHLEHPHLVDTKFKRILVEVKDGEFGCFYLSENLDEPVDSKHIAKKTEWEDYLYELPQPLDVLHQHAASGGPVDLYNNQDFCFLLGPNVNKAKDQCINPEGFASFIGLLGSIPLHDAVSSNESSYSKPDLRYVFKKSFGRGSYGEVWLAFHWNCNQDSNAAKMSKDGNNKNSSSTTSNCQEGPSNYTQYILKRIMVERGSAVYLSGLREKYFGEIFLNASTCVENLFSDGKSNCVLETSQFGSDNSFPNKFWLQRISYEEGLNHIARYVESFESQANEIWLVFSYEGVSLTKLLYTVEDGFGTAEKERVEQVEHVQILRPSNWWHWLKTTEEGQEEMRNLIWQLRIW